MTNAEFLEKMSEEFAKFANTFDGLNVFSTKLKTRLREVIKKDFGELVIYDFECDRDFIEKVENSFGNYFWCFFLRYFIGEQHNLRYGEFLLKEDCLQKDALISFKFGEVDIVFYFMGAALENKNKLAKVIKKTLAEFAKETYKE